MRLGSALLVAGCGFRAGHVLPFDAGDAAPVTSDVVDASIMIDSMIDSDRDGILDSADNCPAIANADQHDEDGDQVGDACDPCPQVASAPSTDTDGDGIPDACDPHPGTSGDRL